MRIKRRVGGSYFEGIGGAFELDFELHHGAGLVGADDNGQGLKRGEREWPPMIFLKTVTRTLFGCGANVADAAE
ncbi:hypothetical protein VNO80_26740 [Phaseolus coccineus]|uniref:Uncharacterized protein n=1 Tax=Phaseolus coccineus TaxID=3886 RepID=A0AAN9QHF3_PHACN